MTSFKELNFTFENEIIRIELNTADRRNTLGSALLGELAQALDLVKQENRAKMVILTGSGRAFSVGADIAEIDALSPPEVGEFARKGQAVIKALMGLEIPTLAAVNGLALGGGFELALACDIRWSHTRAAFGFPECKLELIPAWGGIQLLGLALSPSLQAELLLSGDLLSAQAAYQMGLVSRIFEGKDFIAQVVEESKKFLSKERHVLKEVKRLIQGKYTFEQGLSEATSAFHKLWSHPGRKERTRDRSTERVAHSN